MRTKRDKLFILVLAVVLGNLAYQLSKLLSYTSLNLCNAWFWALAVCNVIAIIGLLWLMRSYRKQLGVTGQPKIFRNTFGKIFTALRRDRNDKEDSSPEKD